MAKGKIQLPEGIPLLTTYYMYLTGGCNLACRHCWIAPTYQANGGTGGHLDYDLYELAINEAEPLGLRSIKYTGGEPLLHPDFIRIVDYATKKGISTWMETNGTLITQPIAFYLKEKTSLQFISVSMDGASASTHDYLRNVTGCFELARKGICNLVDVGYQPQVIMSLFPGNVNEIEVLVRWAEKIGCGSVKFNILQPSGRGELMKQRGELLEIPKLLEIGRWIEKELQKSISIPLLFSWPVAFYGINRLVKGRDEECNIEHILGILSTGQFSMCGIGTQEEELVYGQLGKDPLDEVWIRNSAIINMRERISSTMEGVCGNCIHQSSCKGSCVAQNYLNSGRLTSSFWFCQMAEDRDLFPVTRKRCIV